MHACREELWAQGSVHTDVPGADVWMVKSPSLVGVGVMAIEVTTLRVSCATAALARRSHVRMAMDASMSMVVAVVEKRLGASC